MKVDPILIMQREARKRLPRQPGILIPGWFWQEWLLVAIALATCAGIGLVVFG